MRVLLDECVDRRLAKHLEGFAVQTVAGMGWAGIKNGELLALSQSAFDVLITVDRNLSFQQDLPRFTVAVVVVASASNRLADLVKLAPEICKAIPGAPKGAVTRIGLEHHSRP